MPDRLPINLVDLLRQRTVEGERIEYKAGCNPDAIIRTLCTFANDFENLGGGNVVIGQDCDTRGSRYCLRWLWLTLWPVVQKGHCSSNPTVGCNVTA